MDKFVVSSHGACLACGRMLNSFHEAEHHKCKPAVHKPAPVIHNWLGMPVHPTDDWAHWQNTEVEMAAARELYDTIARFLPSDKYAKTLQQLIKWARENAARDESDANNPDL